MQIAVPTIVTMKVCLASLSASSGLATRSLLVRKRLDVRDDVQDLLGHRDVRVMQTYDKRRRSTKESASHRLVI